MFREQIIRLVAGAFVLVGLALGWYVSAYGYLLTAFVGVNLFQSSLTGFCPLEIILKKAHIGTEGV